MMKPFARRSPRWLATSIAIHIVVVAALLQIVFRYPLGQLIGLTEPELKERIQYVKLPAQPTEHSGGGLAATPIKSAAPAKLETPVVTPTKVPEAHPSDSSRAHAAGGTGSGFGVSGSGLATGIVPRLPDRRIALAPSVLTRTPRSLAEDVDSIVDLAIGIVRDSMAIAMGKRKPGDWTIKGKDGQTWGWDQSGIRLGKVTIPQALLALLPLNVGSGQSPIEARSAAFIRRDIMDNGQRAISEDEFRAAVKRIRERKEREKREKQVASDTKNQPPQPTPPQQPPAQP
jgi:hypothetical protein